MELLTRRQENIWNKKMVELERQCVAYYAKKASNQTTVEPPDGSFCMSAFKNGYYLRRKVAK